MIHPEQIALVATTLRDAATVLFDRAEAEGTDDSLSADDQKLRREIHTRHGNALWTLSHQVVDSLRLLARIDDAIRGQESR